MEPIYTMFYMTETDGVTEQLEGSADRIKREIERLGLSPDGCAIIEGRPLKGLNDRSWPKAIQVKGTRV